MKKKNLHLSKSPIIVSGMHRSGTSLVSKILIDLNVYMGSKLDKNNESIFFQRLNRWMLSCIGASWDNPKTFTDLDSVDKNIIINKLNNSLDTLYAKYFYFGLKKSFKGEKFSNISYNWGWKDPSNTFTLPIWNRIFDNSKNIYVLRHPLDVSISLINRNNKLEIDDKRNKPFSMLFNYAQFLSIAKGGISKSLILKKMDDCLILYNKYLDEVNSNSFRNIHFIKYEELILDTEKTLTELCNYLDIPFNQMKINNIKNYLDSSRAYSYKKKSPYSFNKKLINKNIY
ncbi:MAG: hypothetical protein CMD65_03355 [Gammaproteobacteria bacterium]|nr:hypothetical protein [Gammaproteobacteria bacterium]